MTDKNNDINKYNAAAIERYLHGDMSPEEMHSLELAALDDPFLADAIEGYQQKDSHRSSVTGTDLQELQHRLQTRLTAAEHKKVIPLLQRNWWKVAAVLLLTAGSATLIYYLNDKNNLSKDLVAASEQYKDIQPSAADTVSTGRDTASNAASLAITQHSSIRKEKKITGKPFAAPNAEKPALVSRAPSPAPDLSAVQQPDSLLALNKAEDLPAGNTITPGIATRQARVRVLETNQKAAAADSNRITMMVQDALPVIGLSAFNRYVELNQKLPPDSLHLHGEVILSFIVNENGSVSDFKIEQSLSKQTDDETIRLIKEGPAWKQLRNRKAKAMIRMKF